MAMYPLWQRQAGSQANETSPSPAGRSRTSQYTPKIEPESAEFEAERVAAAYCKYQLFNGELQLRQLSKFCAHPKNRMGAPPNITHALKLAGKILGKQGFSHDRYHRVVAIMECTKGGLYQAMKDVYKEDRFPHITQDVEMGTIRCTHLVIALLLIAQGATGLDGKTKLSNHGRSKPLNEVFENGVKTLILSPAIEESPDEIQLLVQWENKDQDENLVTHHMQKNMSMVRTLSQYPTLGSMALVDSVRKTGVPLTDTEGKSFHPLVQSVPAELLQEVCLWHSLACDGEVQFDSKQLKAIQTIGSTMIPSAPLLKCGLLAGLLSGGVSAADITSYVKARPEQQNQVNGEILCARSLVKEHSSNLTQRAQIELPLEFCKKLLPLLKDKSSLKVDALVAKFKDQVLSGGKQAKTDTMHATPQKKLEFDDTFSLVTSAEQVAANQGFTAGEEIVLMSDFAYAGVKDAALPQVKKGGASKVQPDEFVAKKGVKAKIESVSLIEGGVVLNVILDGKNVEPAVDGNIVVPLSSTLARPVNTPATQQQEDEPQKLPRPEVHDGNWWAVPATQCSVSAKAVMNQVQASVLMFKKIDFAIDNFDFFKTKDGLKVVAAADFGSGSIVFGPVTTDVRRATKPSLQNVSAMPWLNDSLVFDSKGKDDKMRFLFWNVRRLSRTQLEQKKASANMQIQMVGLKMTPAWEMENGNPLLQKLKTPDAFTFQVPIMINTKDIRKGEELLCVDDTKEKKQEAEAQKREAQSSAASSQASGAKEEKPAPPSKKARARR